MKKTNSPLLIIVFSSLLFTLSCGDDEGSETPFEGTTWNMVSDSFTGCTDPLDNEVETFSCPSECLQLTFSGGTLTIVETSGGGSDTDMEPYTISGNTVTIPEAGGSNNFTFSIVGNTLTLVSTDSAPDGCTETVILTAE